MSFSVAPSFWQGYWQDIFNLKQQLLDFLNSYLETIEQKLALGQQSLKEIGHRRLFLTGIAILASFVNFLLSPRTRGEGWGAVKKLRLLQGLLYFFKGFNQLFRFHLECQEERNTFFSQLQSNFSEFFYPDLITARCYRKLTAS